jgi:hypothetical protein
VQDTDRHMFMYVPCPHHRIAKSSDLIIRLGGIQGQGNTKKLRVTIFDSKFN